jgi:hypothetical protein
MSRKHHDEIPSSTDRRSFLTGAAALGAAATALTSRPANAEVKFPTQPGRFGAGGAAGAPGSVFS